VGAVSADRADNVIGVVMGKTSGRPAARQNTGALYRFA